MTKAFLYRWTQKSTGMWYEGSRTAKGCHPDDGYICSSKTVEPMIVENQEDWTREILVIGESKYIRKLEEVRLTSIDAKNDPMSYNKDNANGKFTTTGMPSWSKGLTKETDRRLENLSKSTKGKPSVLKGKKWGKYPAERVQAAASALKGLEPWNKGLTKNEHNGLAKLAKIQNTLVAEGKHNFSKLKGIPKTEEQNQKQRKPKHAGHGTKVSVARKGKIFLPRVSRIQDRKEMDIGNFSKWLKRQGNA